MDGWTWRGWTEGHGGDTQTHGPDRRTDSGVKGRMDRQTQRGEMDGQTEGHRNEKVEMGKRTEGHRGRDGWTDGYGGGKDGRTWWGV